ncbi:MAG: hypothetical protein HYY79_06020 [Betaproteobacteria bacterium]|nr:hypothetical protein [Betaproteobacteria bacterium]
MLNWLFGKKNQATRGPDCVWMSGAAKLKGMCHEAERAAETGRSVLVVAWTLGAIDELADGLAKRQPLRCKDSFQRDALLRQLGQAGSVTVTLAKALPPEIKSAPTVPVEILVFGRNDTRAADDAIVHFADAIGKGARVTFHLSFDDALLHEETDSLKPLLARLGLTQDEAISHPAVTRSIAQVQAKKSAASGGPVRRA